MTCRKLTRKLRRLGCASERQAGGSHEIWGNPANNQETTIPRHANRDLATGTIHGIRRELGITGQEFDRAQNGFEFKAAFHILGNQKAQSAL